MHQLDEIRLGSTVVKRYEANFKRGNLKSAKTKDESNRARLLQKKLSLLYLWVCHERLEIYMKSHLIAVTVVLSLFSMLSVLSAQELKRGGENQGSTTQGARPLNTTIKVALGDTIGSALPQKSRWLSDIVVSLEAEEVQQVKSGGVTFSLQFTNLTTNVVTLANPLDSIGITLLDKTERMMDLPVTLHRGFIHSDNAKGEKKVNYPFRVMEADLNRVPLNEKVNVAEIVLPPSQTLRLTLHIDKVLQPTSSEGKDNRPKDKPIGQPTHLQNVMPLPPGKYRLRVAVTLIDSIGTRESQEMRFRPLKSTFVEIGFGSLIGK